MRFTLLAFFTCCCSAAGVSQNFLWQKSFGTKGGETVIATVAEDRETSVHLIRHMNFAGQTDTLNFDTARYILPFVASNYNRTFFSRLDSGGRVIKVKYIGNLMPSDMVNDDSGNFYITGYILDTNIVTKVENITLKRRNGGLILAKFDNAFNLRWVKQAGNDTTRGYLLSRSGSHIYFTCISAGRTVLGSQIINFAPLLNNNYSFAFGELNTQNGSFKWANYFFNTVSSLMIFDINRMYRIRDHIFFAGGSKNFNPSLYSIVVSGDTFSDGGFIIKADTFGNYISKMEIASQAVADGIRDLATDGRNLFIIGGFGDSILWNNTYIGSGYTTTGSQLPYNFFVASISPDLVQQWIYRPKIVNPVYSPVYRNGAGFLNRIIASGDFLYISGYYSDVIMMDSNIMTPPVIGANGVYRPDPLVFKMDLIGNVLWAAQGKTTGDITSLDAIPGKSVYAGGFYSGILTFGSHRDTAHPSYSSFPASDAFISRISDNSITRGEVKKGPYCAGDTILIPYTKIGDYDTSNHFIAELSNEHGNFTGGHRLLGRLKANKDSIITGRLPMFQVISSPKYRIRILSTAPAVQSYYRVDSLRLLIYSRDKADPGKDTTICLGDTISIQTFGGTRWTWSEKYNMADSTARVTKVWPHKNSIYKIIIADSSGCGEADTAYKTVLVKNELSVRFTLPESITICRNGSIPLTASFTGGDSCGYYWQWVSIDKNGIYSYLKEDKNKLADTLLYTMPAGADSMQFVIYLNDSCTAKIGFATYTLRVSLEKAITTFKETDTSVCPNKPLPIVAGFSKGYAPGYNWIWQEKTSTGVWVQRKTGSGKQADTFNYSLPVTWKGIKQIRVILKDNCSPLTDTAMYLVTPRDTLDAVFNTKDTVLCSGQDYKFLVKGKGGFAPGYQFVWTDFISGQVLSAADSLHITADTTRIVKLTLNDGCMPRPFNALVNIGMYPGLDIQIRGGKDTALCYGQSLMLQSSSKGGKGAGYSHKWLLNSRLIGTGDSLFLNPQHYKSLTGSKAKLSVILSDQCTVNPDTASITIEFLAPLSQKLLFKDSACYRSGVSFKSSGSGGTGTYLYKWLDQDGNDLGKQDSIVFNYNNSAQSGLLMRFCILGDGCSKNDTAEAFTQLLPPLSLSISVSDTCPTVSSLLTAGITGGKGYNYKVSWYKNHTFIPGNTGTQNIIPDAQPAVYKAVVNDGCSQASDTAFVRLALKPQVRISVKNPCLGEMVTLKASSSTPSSFNWKINAVDVLTSHDSILTASFGAAGKQTIQVRTVSQNCAGTDSTDIFIVEKPVADFDYAHFAPNSSGIPFHFINLSSGSDAWNWNFAGQGSSSMKDPDFTFPKTGNFKITMIASKNNTCFDTITRNLPVLERIEFFFPNVFSPNGNHINDEFGLNTNQHYMVKEFHLEVFNRWGEKVFETDDVTKTWKGEKAQQGVYIYKASIRDVYNVLHDDIKGIVELMK